MVRPQVPIFRVLTNTGLVSKVVQLFLTVNYKLYCHVKYQAMVI